jgi:hypothetical protein
MEFVSVCCFVKAEVLQWPDHLSKEQGGRNSWSNRTNITKQLLIYKKKKYCLPINIE